ncbi:TRAP transporter substrate-binding protein [Paraburkholderia sp. ZP32-5]|uniref:TRAP transporter substrate-binding protein n=1 Tax=Paraburkholderia sp. ZP32-5 TaxID=2883245 RepID=UPI001F288CA3|nr:TRAP transporter substrate-binding protein [Paraburkholderia sp. ZP32-5]
MEKPARRLVLKTGVALAAAPLVARFAHAAEVRIKVGSDTPPAYAMNVRMKEAAERIKTRTNGRVEVSLFPNSQLGSDMLNQVHSGSLDFFLSSSQLAVPLVPACALPGVAYGLKDTPSAFKAMDGDVGAYLRAQMEPAGLFALPAMMQGGWRQIISNKPIRTPDDLVGFKIRVPISPMWVSQFKDLGASPTPISINELYTALQTKVVDGAENYPSLLYAMRLYEIQKYMSTTNHMWDGYWILGNARMWAAVPKDMQQVISEEFTKSVMQQRDDMVKVDAQVPDEMKKHGITFIDPDRDQFRDKLKQAGYYAEWKQKFGPQAWALLEKYSGPLG